MESDTSEFQRTAGSAGIIGVSAAGGAVVGFVLQLLVAYYFGAGAKTDAYFMAQSTSELLSKLLLGGSIASLFIPIFIHTISKHGKDEAWKQALNIIHVIGVLFLIVVSIIAIFTKPFIHFIAPGFDEPTTILTVHILRVLLPSFFFLFLVDMGTSILHSLKQFTVPATMRMVAPLTSSIIVLLFASRYGIGSLAGGAVVGSIIQISLITYALRRQGFHYRFVFHPLDASLKRILHLAYPFIFSMLVTQVAGLVYRILVSHLAPGSLASLKFAEKITQLLTVIFLTSVTSVIYPTLSEKASREDTAGIRETIASAIRLIVFISLPMVIGVALLRHQIISLIYERGLFDAHNASQTSIALLYLVIGLTTNGISAVFGYTVLALQRTRASVVVTIISHLIAITLFFLLVPMMGHAGLALGSSLVPLATAALYFAYLTKFVPNLFSIFIHRTYLKTIVLSLGLFLLVYVLRPITASVPVTHLPSLLIQIIVPAALGASLYFALAYMWKISEIQELTQIIKKRLQKIISPKISGSRV